MRAPRRAEMKAPGSPQFTPAPICLTEGQTTLIGRFMVDSNCNRDNPVEEKKGRFLL